MARVPYGAGCKGGVAIPVDLCIMRHMDDFKNYRAPLGAFQLIAQEYAGELLFCIFLLALLLDKLGA